MHPMATGVSIDRRQGNLDTVKVWSYSHRHSQSQTLSEAFKKKKKAEYTNTYARSISNLQQSILKIFEESLHCDLYIIHGSCVLQTNCCILKTRSPHLYNYLKKYFTYNKNPIKCYLNTPDIFHQIEGFVSLLYCNLDISRQEHCLIEFILRIENTILIDGNLEEKDISEDNDDVVDLSPSKSDMADSGLETGSVSLHENTESENSGTDLEESHVTDYVSTDDDFIRVSLSGDVEKPCNKNTTTHHQDDCCNRDPINNEGTETILSDVWACGANESASQERADLSRDEIRTCDIVDDVTRYENEVLNDPFYESDSNDNEQSGSFVPTGSFEFIEPGNLSPIEIAARQSGSFDSPQDEKLCSNHETRSMIVENVRHGLTHSNDLILKKSFSSINNYCFIDASTLNDEPELASINITKDKSDTGTNVPTFSESVTFVPSTSFDSEDTSSKSSRKILQSGHERTAEFERELKLTEYRMPVTELRKIKRANSISEENADEKPIEKEALVVEIKEADSGESNHPSPCIDNNKKVQRENEVTVAVNDNLTAENCSDSRRSSLIRRNTFELDSGDEQLSHLRQEYERRQGNLVFKNSIRQYSGHRVDGGLSFDEASYSSVPYFTEVASHNSNRGENVRYLLHRNDSYALSQSLIEATRSFDEKELQQADKSKDIFPFAKSASDKFLATGSETDESSIDCNSLPITFDHTAAVNKSSTMKRSKRDEMTPIVSGGVSAIDYSKSTDSPTVRRKTESTPIVSGGSVLINVASEKIRSTKMSSSMNAWVVDMSDCGKNPRSSNGSSSSSMSQSYSCSDSASKSLNKSKVSEKQASLGFFVNLKDIDSPKPIRSNSIQPGKSDKEAPKSCEFFIDISDESEKSSKNCKELESRDKAHSSEDKKNIFPMFIDLGESSRKKPADGAKGHKPIQTQAVKSGDSGKECTGESSQEVRSTEKKPCVFMYIDSDSPVVRRRTLSTSRPALQRHSWNLDKSQAPNGGNTKDPAFRREHKRAHSVSIDPAVHKSLQAKTSGSSNSLSQIGRAISLQVPDGPSTRNTNSIKSSEIIDYVIRDTPPNSHVEIMDNNLRNSIKRQEYAESLRNEMGSSTDASVDPKMEDDRSEVSVWEKTGTESTEGHTRKSETFDISSGSASEPSPGSDKDFDIGEYRNAPAFTDRRLEAEQTTSKGLETHKFVKKTIQKNECEFRKPEYVAPEATKEDINHDSKISKIEAKDSKVASGSSFVRLSDLDKTPVKSQTEDSIRPKSLPYRMSTSIPEMSWVESKLAVNRSNGPCQVRILSSRKFTSIMSTSLPAKHKSPIEEFGNEAEGEGIISESDLSSMQSSMGRSGADVSTEETETSSFAGVKQYNRLGEDLLRMFLEEINPDVTVEVSGRHIRAHKCILSSRCQYFAAILSGDWVENAGNVISLQGYSYSAVHFALCHIYSGESNIPDSISIVELATLADMLCLEGLKEVIGYTIKVKYCHLFHKPCQLCAVGVLECMPLAAAYGLDEVYRKSLRWITRHFVRIWPCKAFASLPKELMDKCYHQHVVHMSADNVLQTIMDCDKLLATLPNVRWAEPVFRMVSNLLETGLKFISENFSSVLSNDSFQALGRDLMWNISRLEDNVLTSADRLPPDQACKSYSKLHKMLAATRADDPQVKMQWGPLFIDFLKKIQIRVEKCLVKEAPRAARTTAWMKMDLELRRRIQELACLVILPHEALKRPSRHSNFVKESKAPPSRTTASRSLDLRRVKLTITEQHDKILRPNTNQSTKKIIPKPRSDPLERKMPEIKPLAAESAVRPKSWPNKLEIKSRYLEPRTKSVPKESTQPAMPERSLVQQRRKIMISSSDSSRTSSPAMKRATDKKTLMKLKPAVKKDVKALSSDSLAEASGVKPSTKREPLSKSCGITRPESPSLKTKEIDIGLSADSLAECKKKPVPIKKANRLDTSMSTDSLMTEVVGTPKSSTSNKISPTLGRPTAKSLALEKAKKSSPPLNQKSPLSVARRPVRSIESSTAASRNRVAAITAYHGSPNLRRNLLDAAKTPDVSSKVANGVVSRVGARQSVPSTSTSPSVKREKKESNPSSSESPSKRSPKSNGINRPSRVTQITRKSVGKGAEDKIKTACHNGETLKQLTVGSRSGTFLKDEPTILKKSDMKSKQVT